MKNHEKIHFYKINVIKPFASSNKNPIAPNCQIATLKLPPKVQFLPFLLEQNPQKCTFVSRDFCF